MVDERSGSLASANVHARQATRLPITCGAPPWAVRVDEPDEIDSSTLWRVESPIVPDCEKGENERERARKRRTSEKGREIGKIRDKGEKRRKRASRALRNHRGHAVGEGGELVVVEEHICGLGARPDVAEAAREDLEPRAHEVRLCVECAECVRGARKAPVHRRVSRETSS